MLQHTITIGRCFGDQRAGHRHRPFCDSLCFAQLLNLVFVLGASRRHSAIQITAYFDTDLVQRVGEYQRQSAIRINFGDSRPP